jgi:hypothetical protein
VGAKGVRLDDVGTRLDVLVVDLADEAGVRQVELVEAAVQEDPARVEHGAHGPVEDDGALGQPVEEGLHGGGPCLFAHPLESTSEPQEGRLAK